MKGHGHKLKRDVKNELERVTECFEAIVEYNGEVHHAPIFKLKAVNIKLGSFYEHIVADWM